MSYENYSVVDCDGDIVESIPELAEFMSDRIKGHALRPNRNRQGVFPPLDGMHFALHEEGAKTRKRITAASTGRDQASTGSICRRRSTRSKRSPSAKT
jgi:hypothetical protein